MHNRKKPFAEPEQVCWKFLLSVLVLSAACKDRGQRVVVPCRGPDDAAIVSGAWTESLLQRESEKCLQTG